MEPLITIRTTGNAAGPVGSPGIASNKSAPADAGGNSVSNGLGALAPGVGAVPSNKLAESLTNSDVAAPPRKIVVRFTADFLDKHPAIAEHLKSSPRKFTASELSAALGDPKQSTFAAAVMAHIVDRRGDEGAWAKNLIEAHSNRAQILQNLVPFKNYLSISDEANIAEGRSHGHVEVAVFANEGDRSLASKSEGPGRESHKLGEQGKPRPEAVPRKRSHAAEEAGAQPKAAHAIEKRRPAKDLQESVNAEVVAGKHVPLKAAGGRPAQKALTTMGVPQNGGVRKQSADQVKADRRVKDLQDSAEAFKANIEREKAQIAGCKRVIVSSDEEIVHLKSKADKLHKSYVGYATASVLGAISGTALFVTVFPVGAAVLAVTVVSAILGSFRKKERDLCDDAVVSHQLAKMSSEKHIAEAEHSLHAAEAELVKVETELEKVGLK